MSEYDLVKLQAFQFAEFYGIFRSLFYGFIHQPVETFQGGVCLAVENDQIAKFLQRGKDGC